MWLPDGKKVSKICHESKNRRFILTWSTNVTDTHTQRQTDTTWRHRPRLCIASLGKNQQPETVILLNTSWKAATVLPKVGHYVLRDKLRDEIVYRCKVQTPRACSASSGHTWSTGNTAAPPWVKTVNGWSERTEPLWTWHRSRSSCVTRRCYTHKFNYRLSCLLAVSNLKGMLHS